jgi:3-O-methylgallate 3,4-dioxygenase
MARLVAAFGSSHSVMLSAEREHWIAAFRESDQRMPLYDRSGAKRTYAEVLAAAPKDAQGRVTEGKMLVAHERTFAAVAELRRQIESTEMDVLIIAGDDQHELFQDTMMPALAIYYGETIRNAARTDGRTEDWYGRAQMQRLEPMRDAHYPVHAKLALHFITGLVEREFDVCAVGGLTGEQYEGHAYSYIHRTYLEGRNLPVVPIMLNTYYPPNPVTPHRCVALGRRLRELIRSYPDDLRVGIIASGGLSHFVVDEDLDYGVIDAMKNDDLEYLAHLDPKRLQAGSSEIRSWIVTAAAATDLSLGWLEYIPVYRTPALTGIGMAFARWS